MSEEFFKRSIGAIVFFGLGFLLGVALAEVRACRIAIEAGAAEWRIDATTGEKSFHYLKQGEAKDAVQE